MNNPAVRTLTMSYGAEDYLIPIVLGVAAQNGIAADEARLSDAISGQLIKIRNTFPNSPFLIISSLAASPNRGWGLAKQLPTNEAAEKDAIERCSKSNSGCELRVAFSNCAVYATSSDGTWAWATDSTVDLARPAAVAECHKYTSQLCGSHIELCAD